jgi:hypothetical protein
MAQEAVKKGKPKEEAVAETPLFAEAEAQALLEVVEAAFPERTGRRRKIHCLWGNYFRVNMHDPYNENKIAESHFVVVASGEAVEL